MRKNGAGAYRYGFKGKENDKNISEGGQDYGMRIINNRLGRFLSVDPLTGNFAMLTPYQFASNTPIQSIDLDRLAAVDYYSGNPFTNGFSIAKNISGPYIAEYLNNLGYVTLEQVHKIQDQKKQDESNAARLDAHNRHNAGIRAK